MTVQTQKTENNTVAYVLRFWRGYCALSWNMKGYVLMLLAGLCVAGSLAIFSYLPQTPSPTYTKIEQWWSTISICLFFLFLVLSWTACLFITPWWVKSKEVIGNDN
jgi:hypothetical protein